MDRFKQVISAIDEWNGQDPNKDTIENFEYPAELLYSKHLTDWVLRLAPQASEELRIAARGQHICRWMIPRDKYPMDRGGYLRWREDLKKFHAEKVEGLMKASGYEEKSIERVKTIILKKGLKEDLEVQTMEDALCLVFLENQLADLMEKTEKPKMIEIVKKTWGKMSPKGKEIARKLPLRADVQKFLIETLEPS